MSLNKNYSTLNRITILFCSLILIFSCASDKGIKPSVQKPAQPVEVTPVNETVSASDLITQAQQLPPIQAVETLIKAANQLLTEQQFDQAAWLAHQLTVLTQDSDQLYQLAIVKSHSLLALGELERAHLALAKADQIQQTRTSSHTLTYYQLAKEIQTQRQLTVLATNAQLNAFVLNHNASIDDINAIWQNLTHLSSWQLEQLAQLKPPFFNGWQQLITIANKHGAEEPTFRRFLSQWQQNHPTHPANDVVTELLSSLGTQSVVNLANVAVILPLSGKQAAAGKVAQQGILAAFNNNTEQQLHFIDANQIAMETLPDKLAEIEADYIIGPLLREHVSAFLALDEITIPSLLLNIPSNIELKAHQVAFSMRPEDEAIQAATMLANQNYQHPLVISLEDNVSKRMTQTFIQHWQRMSGQAPEVIYVDANNNMQLALKASLDVDLSQQRISQINARIRQTIKHEARNRRDIDMIYIVGSPKETRLLKPYIDVNISPFASLIPVYASSRSHSANADSSDARDLTGLTFTEMPWLLPSKQQNQPLMAISKKFWPQRSDSLQRIFAMGFDSMALIEKLELMKQKPYIRHFGQTGILKLDNNNILTRSLLWGKYLKEKVQAIAME